MYTSPTLLKEKQKALPLQRLGFRFIGAATWQRHCGTTRKSGTAFPVTAQKIGEHLDHRFLAVDRILLIFPATSQFINQQQL